MPFQTPPAAAPARRATTHCLTRQLLMEPDSHCQRSPFELPPEVLPEQVAPFVVAEVPTASVVVPGEEKKEGDPWAAGGEDPFQQLSDLPEGWEKKWSEDGNRWFYIDHNTQTTHWDPPMRTEEFKTQEQLDKESNTLWGWAHSAAANAGAASAMTTNWASEQWKRNNGNSRVATMQYQVIIPVHTVHQHSDVES